MEIRGNVYAQPICRGIILNTKTYLGVSPIITISYVLHVLLKIEFSDMTLLLYCSFAVMEIIIHLFQKHFKAIIGDCLQIPLSLVFTRFIKIFDHSIPMFTATGDSVFNTFYLRILFMFLGIILTGIGLYFSVGMRIIPNPADGIVQTLGDLFHIRLGLMKNIFDCVMVAISVTLGLTLNGQIVGIGVGTLLSMIGVGRVVAVCTHFLKSKTDKVLPAKADYNIVADEVD